MLLVNVNNPFYSNCTCRLIALPPVAMGRRDKPAPGGAARGLRVVVQATRGACKRQLPRPLKLLPVATATARAVVRVAGARYERKELI